MSNFIKVLTVILKLIYFIIKLYLRGDLKERKKLEERLKNLSDLLKKSREDNSEAKNEEDYLSNLNWENKKRYEFYKKLLLENLENKNSFESISKINSMGLMERISLCYEKAFSIFNSNLDDSSKASEIAKLLIEV